MTEHATPKRRVADVALSVLRWLLAIAFIAAAWPKLQGRADTIAVFAHIGLGQWFRVFTGALEVLGATLLILPRTAFMGATLLITVMAGAIATHLFILHNAPIAALIYFAPSALVAWSRREDLRRFLQRTKSICES